MHSRELDGLWGQGCGLLTDEISTVVYVDSHVSTLDK